MSGNPPPSREEAQEAEGWMAGDDRSLRAASIDRAWECLQGVASGRLVDREAMTEETNVARLKGPMRLRRRFVTEWELVDE